MDNNFDLKQQITKNIKWIGISQFVGYAIQFVVWAFLARMLSPDSFGALGIAAAVLNALILFNELGLSSAIIQKKDVEERHKDVVFWVCAGMGFLFLTIAFAISPFFVKFFRNGEVSSLILIFAVKYFIDSFGIVHNALLVKEMFFKKIAFIEVLSGILFGVVSIVMVLSGFGISSFAWGYTAGGILRIILLWINCPFKPSISFSLMDFKELFGYGRNIVGFKVLSYFSGNIDIFLIGRILGTFVLGYYSLAMNLINFPRQKICSIISTIAFSAFSKIQDDVGTLCQTYLQMIKYAAIFNFPILLGLMFISPQFVRIVYTSKWMYMVLPLQILCVYGISFSLTTFIGLIFDSTGHPEYSFRFGLYSLIGTVFAVLVGLKFGLRGIAVALSIYSIIMNLLGHAMVKQLIKASFREYFKSLVSAAVCSLAMAMGLIVLTLIQKNLLYLPDFWFMTLMIFTGIVLYIASLFFLARDSFYGFMELTRKMFISV